MIRIGTVGLTRVEDVVEMWVETQSGRLESTTFDSEMVDTLIATLQVMRNHQERAKKLAPFAELRSVLETALNRAHPAGPASGPPV